MICLIIPIVMAYGQSTDQDDRKERLSSITETFVVVEASLYTGYIYIYIYIYICIHTHMYIYIYIYIYI